MKFFKIIGIVLLILIVIIGVLSFIAPTKMESERSITIQAPQQIVWQQICSLQKQLEWGPWKQEDPNMQVTYSGTDCTIGAHASWVSENKHVGSGEQEIIAIDPMKRVDTKLHFLEPYESEAKGWTSMEADPSGGVKVSWGFNSNMPRPMNAMMLFMNVEKSMNEMFDSGLSNLKKVAEKAAAEEASHIQDMQVMSDTAMQEMNGTK